MLIRTWLIIGFTAAAAAIAWACDMKNPSKAHIYILDFSSPQAFFEANFFDKTL